MKLAYITSTPTGRFRAKFRHSITKRIVDIALNSRDPADAFRVSEALTTLQKTTQYHSPDQEESARRVLDPVACEIFFRPLRNRKAGEFFGKHPSVVVEYDSADGIPTNFGSLEDAMTDLSNLRVENQLLSRKCRMLERELSRLGHSPNNALTLAAAFDRWSAEFHSRSERQRKSVIRRVKFVLAGLQNAKFSELTHTSVVKAIDSSMLVVRSRTGKAAGSQYEKSYRVRDTKRFLTWCAEEYDLRALTKISQSLHAPSVETIARSQRGAVSVLDLKLVEKLLAGHDAAPFNSIMEATYWRAMLGSLVYGGLRLGELCSLTWSDVDFVRQLLSVRDSSTRLTKTVQSNRPIKPIPDVWPLLRALQPVTGQSPLVFPALLEGKLTDQNWLVEQDGKMIAVRLTRCLIRMEEIFGLGRQIPMRARRTCRTLMLNKGIPPHVVNTMMGHDGRVGVAHYENAMEIVAGVKYA